MPRNSHNPGWFEMTPSDKLKISGLVDSAFKMFVPGSDEWHVVRNLKGTSYGRALYDLMASFYPDDADELREITSSLQYLVNVIPSLLHPSHVSLMDGTGILSSVVFALDKDSPFWDDPSLKVMEDSSSPGHALKNRVPRLMLMDEVTGVESSDLNELGVDALSRLHGLDMMLRKSNRGLKHLGRKGDLEVFQVLENVFSVPSGELLIGEAPSLVTVLPDDEEMMFIEDNYPTLLIRDMVLHTIVTGTEFLLETFPRMGDDGWDHSAHPVLVSTRDCGWLLDNVEVRLAEFIGLMYRVRRLAQGISIGAGGPVLDHQSYDADNAVMDANLYDALWSEAVEDHDLGFRVVDIADVWGVGLGVKTYRLVPAVQLNDLRLNLMSISGEDALLDAGVDLEPLKAIIGNLLIRTNKMAFNRNYKAVNETVSAFELLTYSSVMSSKEAGGVGIDPLSEMPEVGLHSVNTRDLIQRFQGSMAELVQNPKIQYLGRRHGDGRLVFVHVDDEGNLVDPLPKIPVKIEF